MNPSLVRTENSWEHGASFSIDGAVSFPKSESSISCLQAFHALIKVTENSTVSNNRIKLKSLTRHEKHPDNPWQQADGELRRHTRKRVTGRLTG